MNMPKIDGGDELITPLNVTQNGDQNPIPAARHHRSATARAPAAA
jgi:hypothetical protein